MDDVPGCQGLGSRFRDQEIDGRALIVLRETHLFALLQLKLGPALKIQQAILALA